MARLLNLHNFSVSIEEKKIIKNINISIDKGQIHAIMGPNGSGKSSLAYSIMGHRGYTITNGSLEFLGKTLYKIDKNGNLGISVPVDIRAQRGIFLAFQNPYEIHGATVFTILKELYSQRIKKMVSIAAFSAILFGYMDMLKLDRDFAMRNLNQDFSGGEKKKFEILQMLILKPKLAILDEIDSGLDIDALQVVCDTMLQAKKENFQMAIVLITHYQRILKYIKPDVVHVMYKGEIKKSGGSELATNLELHGYNQIVNEKI